MAEWFFMWDTCYWTDHPGQSGLPRQVEALKGCLPTGGI